MSDNLLDLQISLFQVDHQVHCLKVQGELDINTSPRLKKAVDQAIDAGQQVIVIDFNGVRYIDSTGLGVLVASRKRMQESKGSIILICKDRHIMKLLEITGLNRLFDIYPGVDEFNASYTPSKVNGPA